MRGAFLTAPFPDPIAAAQAIPSVVAFGAAVVAWPTRPGETGLSTFIMDHRGAIFEREFGARTAEEARRITAFDPGPGWTRVEQAEP